MNIHFTNWNGSRRNSSLLITTLHVLLIFLFVIKCALFRQYSLCNYLHETPFENVFSKFFVILAKIILVWWLLKVVENFNHNLNHRAKSGSNFFKLLLLIRLRMIYWIKFPQSRKNSIKELKILLIFSSRVKFCIL